MSLTAITRLRKLPRGSKRYYYTIGVLYFTLRTNSIFKPWKTGGKVCILLKSEKWVNLSICN
jgi:hypothetical protein